jgi:hypothetical protein
MSLFERLLSRVFQHIDITGDEAAQGDNIYLRRWFIYPRNPDNNKQARRLYLHKFYLGDRDRHLHDHPWAFRSLILWGGYFEHSFNPEWMRIKAKYKNDPVGLAALIEECDELCKMMGQPAGAYMTIRKWYGPLSFLRRGASWTHRVELPPGKTCWTLILTEKKSRSWGFHTDSGWCWWKNYRDGICWCYDNPNEKIAA